MSVISHASAGESMQLWRRQVGRRERAASTRGPRPFAVLGYRLPGVAVASSLAELRRLTLVALYDAYDDQGKLQTRVVGVGGAMDGEGLRFGGVDLARFDKDLRLAPTAGGRGLRFDAADGELLIFSLGLERHLERCSRYPHAPRRRSPQLPSPAAVEGAAGLTLVDLTSIPKRQVLKFDSAARDLVGRVGAILFDFANTRFRVAD